jgi:hypothetical protein
METDRHGARADIGAVESFFGTIEGTVFLDRNRNGLRESEEPGLVGWHVYLDTSASGRYVQDEPYALTQSDDPKTITVHEEGRFSFRGLNPSSHGVGLTPKSRLGLDLARSTASCR